jgi:hypothetical protein
MKRAFVLVGPWAGHYDGYHQICVLASVRRGRRRRRRDVGVPGNVDEYLAMGRNGDGL